MDGFTDRAKRLIATRGGWGAISAFPFDNAEVLQMRTKHERQLIKATEWLRRPNARLVCMHANGSPEYYVIPGGYVSREIAKELIDRPDVYGSKDGLFPGHDQTWQFAR